MYKKCSIIFIITFFCFLSKNGFAEWVILSSNTGCSFQYETGNLEKIGDKIKVVTKFILSEKNDESIISDVIIDCKNATFKEGFVLYYNHGKVIGSKEHGDSGEILNSQNYKLLYHKVCE